MSEGLFFLAVNLFNLRVADPRLVFICPSRAGGNPESPGAARQLATFFCAAKRRVAKEKAALMSRAFASLALLNEFGVCGTRFRRMRKHIGRAKAQTVLD